MSEKIGQIVYGGSAPNGAILVDDALDCVNPAVRFHIRIGGYVFLANKPYGSSTDLRGYHKIIGFVDHSIGVDILVQGENIFHEYIQQVRQEEIVRLKKRIEDIERCLGEPVFAGEYI